MLLETILRRFESHKGFVFGNARWRERDTKIEIPIRPRKGSRAICSYCGRMLPTYDRLEKREFRFLPLWIFAVTFTYVMRRVHCPEHGVVVEKVPWAHGKSHLTTRFSLFLAHWAKRLSWSEVAGVFEVSWRQVYRAVETVVEYGLANRRLRGVTAIGIDEVQYGHGHQYMTLVYDIGNETRRLLYVGRDRTVKSLLRFFHEQGRAWCAGIRFVCSDMWPPYRKVIAKKLKEAVHILDRFHIVKKLGEAVDKIRAGEARDLQREGKGELLAHTKYCFLKNPENLTPKQELRLRDVLSYRLKSVRAYLLKESFQLFWEYTSAQWAGWYLRKWCARAMRSRLKPIQKFVHTMRRHEGLLLNWFKAKKAFSCGVVEGMNRKVNLITRRAYGFRSFDIMKVVLLHNLAALPEPPNTHRFC